MLEVVKEKIDLSGQGALGSKDFRKAWTKKTVYREKEMDLYNKSNRNLFQVIEKGFEEKGRSKSLTWVIRMKISIETAGALSYLHTSEIVHRDVKTTNIFLADNFSIRVVDFGLSRLFPVDMTHVSTAPQGTPGYLDPEYQNCYQMTNKSDVYSLGAVLVELISSLHAADIRRQEGEMNLSDYAMNRIQRGVLDELVDQKLGYNSDFKVRRMITLVVEFAFQCLQQEKDVRPFMIEVFKTLMRIENMDYKALGAEEMGEKRNWES